MSLQQIMLLTDLFDCPPNVRFDWQVMKTVKAAMQVSVTDLHIDWQLSGDVQMLQVPRQLPALFAGDRLVVYAISSTNQVHDIK